MHLVAGTQAAMPDQQDLASEVAPADGTPAVGASAAAKGPAASGEGPAGTLMPATNEPLDWDTFVAYSLKQLRSITDEMPEALQEAEVLAKASAAAAADAASAEQQAMSPPADNVLGSSAEPPALNAAAQDASTAMEDGELEQDAPHKPDAPDVPAPPLPTSDSAPGIDTPRSKTSASAATAGQASAQPSAAAAAPATATSVSAVPEPDPPPPPPAANPLAAAVATGFAAGRPARLDPSPRSGIAVGPLPPMPGWPPMGAFPPFMPAFHFPPAAPWPPPPMFFFPPPGGAFPGVPAAYAQPVLSVAVSPAEPAPLPDAEEAPPPLPDELDQAAALPLEPGALAFLSAIVCCGTALRIRSCSAAACGCKRSEKLTEV